jgi:hypothetical protein
MKKKPDKKEPLVMLSFRLPPELHQALKEHSAKYRVPVQTLMTRAVRDMTRAR